ncbi:Na+/H+ antiporter NhaC family protein [Bacillus carboniphilus]|uniref:Na+/H+ antiporter NhaC family protein n=1 Tax=Bacillus carboniphilus TaxID=86663 RepID=A0ABY9JWG8_9BACI|nr:Na+/H+ antiporter NhaC family protein [Bacillus carboniphilus]WLR42765.1 Na+/H+ antiporter NhaC family protein [Bacillus carboniphilus]
MSDTTNFASAVASVNIFDHIKHMLKTTIPAIVITFIFFYILSTFHSVDIGTSETISTMKQTLLEGMTIHWITILPPLLVIGLAIYRYPVIPTFVAGILLSMVIALFIQDTTLTEWFAAIQSGPSFSFEFEQVNSMLNKGGLQPMMWSISLILIAFALGGLLQKVGIIDALLNGMKKGIKTRSRAITSTMLSSLGINLVTGEQYLSILIPGQSFEKLYDDLKLSRKDLSRSLEDAGTLINPLIPWGVSGAFLSSTLGVSVVDYLPYAIFLYISPLITLLFVLLSKKVN